MVIDQTSPDFLAQLKDLAKGFLQWVSQEGQGRSILACGSR
jgi:hypothetical protein